MTPVEYGRAAAASKYTALLAVVRKLVGSTVVTGPATGVTLVGTTSSKGDGAQTGIATTSNGNGTGATVSIPSLVMLLAVPLWLLVDLATQLVKPSPLLVTLV